jgi:hypothetical protein
LAERFVNDIRSSYIIGAMADTVPSPEETQILIDYTRQRFAEEPWMFSPALRQVREALDS